MWDIRILPAAVRELEKLDKPLGRRIVQRIRWLAFNIEALRPKELKGTLKGLFKLREGDYRIIYQPIREERTIVIHSIGHRKEVYRRRKFRE